MFHSAEEHRFQEQTDRSLKASNFLRCKSKKTAVVQFLQDLRKIPSVHSFFRPEIV